MTQSWVIEHVVVRNNSAGGFRLYHEIFPTAGAAMESMLERVQHWWSYHGEGGPLTPQQTEAVIAYIKPAENGEGAMLWMKEWEKKHVGNRYRIFRVDTSNDDVREQYPDVGNVTGQCTRGRFISGII